MVVACAALETLTWSNESIFKFNDYATQLTSHYETLDRGGQAKTDEEKVMKLLNSMNTNNVPVQTWTKLNGIGVTFQDAVVNISSSIAQLFPNVNVKGHRVIVSQTRTSSKTSHSTHINGIKFTEATWKRRLGKYNCIPKQIQKIIGFAKLHKIDEKYHAFLAERQEKINNKKRGQEVSEVSCYGPSQDDIEKDVMYCAVSKIVQAFIKSDGPNNDGAPDEGPKSNANAGSSFGKQNAYKGKRGWGSQGESEGNAPLISIDAVVSSIRLCTFSPLSREILSTNCPKENGQVVSSTIESDNLADTWCFGPNFVMDSYTRQTCNISGYNKKFNDTEVSIDTRFTIWTNPTSGKLHLLQVNQGLDMKEILDHTLVNPNQCWLFGISWCDDAWDENRSLGM